MNTLKYIWRLKKKRNKEQQAGEAPNAHESALNEVSAFIVSNHWNFEFCYYNRALPILTNKSRMVNIIRKFNLHDSFLILNAHQKRSSTWNKSTPKITEFPFPQGNPRNRRCLRISGDLKEGLWEDKVGKRSWEVVVWGFRAPEIDSIYFNG